MLRGRVGCLWLQSIKNLLYMKSGMCDSLYFSVQQQQTDGVAKKKPKCVIDYNTHMHDVDTADQYLVYYPFIRKTVKWPKKVFQCCLFNSYVTFSKNNPNSRKSFLDSTSDITDTHIRCCIITVIII